MPELSKETAALLMYLMPGLLTAWIFYGLTSHEKPSQFERIIQALIFVFLIQVLLPLVRWLYAFVRTWLPTPTWDGTFETIASAFIAMVLGLSLAYITNKDWFHKWIRASGFTTRSSHPSEWCNVLSEKRRYIVLHLQDERRLFGYPLIWPSNPEIGHFFIVEPSWLSETGEHIVQSGIDGLLINTKDVKWIEVTNEQAE